MIFNINIFIQFYKIDEIKLYKLKIIIYLK